MQDKGICGTTAVQLILQNTTKVDAGLLKMFVISEARNKSLNMPFINTLFTHLSASSS
jgi:hypothetical protein